MNIFQTEHTFIEETSSINNSKELVIISNYNQAVINVNTTSTDFLIKIEGKISNSDAWSPIFVVGLEDAEVSAEISAGGLYALDLMGLSRVRTKLEKINNGIIEITSRIVK